MALNRYDIIRHSHMILEMKKICRSLISIHEILVSVEGHQSTLAEFVRLTMRVRASRISAENPDEDREIRESDILHASH